MGPWKSTKESCAETWDCLYIFFKNTTPGKTCCPQGNLKCPKLAQWRATQAKPTLDQEWRPHFLGNESNNLTTNYLQQAETCCTKLALNCTLWVQYCTLSLNIHIPNRACRQRKPPAPWHVQLCNPYGSLPFDLPFTFIERYLLQMKNKLRSAASKPIPKIEQSLWYKWGQMYY